MESLQIHTILILIMISLIAVAAQPVREQLSHLMTQEILIFKEILAINLVLYSKLNMKRFMIKGDLRVEPISAEVGTSIILMVLEILTMKD